MATNDRQSVPPLPGNVAGLRAGRLLVADDQSDLLEAVRLLLKGHGYEVVTVTRPRAVLEALRSSRFNAILIDLNYTLDTTSGDEGLALITEIQRVDPSLPVIVMTAWGSVQLAVQAMQRGACDFVEKPFENAKLLKTIRRHLEGPTASDSSLSEMDRAMVVQQQLLPQSLPEIPGIELAAVYRPAGRLGGDYFDVVRIGPDEVSLCIADVAGKGLAAAMMMSNLQSAFKVLLTEGREPNQLCRRMNRFMYSNCAAGAFITLFLARFNTRTRELRYCNAGHLPPMLVRADGNMTRLREGGALLGFFEDWNYETGVAMLADGDRVLLFTDGLAECANSRGEEFGEERIVEIVRNNPSTTQLLSTLFSGAAEHAHNLLADDATAIALAIPPGCAAT